MYLMKKQMIKLIMLHVVRLSESWSLSAMFTLEQSTENWKWKWKLLSHDRLCHPMDYTVHGILQAWILQWVAAPFSKASSQPRDQTQVCLVAGGFFTSWAMREAGEYWSLFLLQGIFPTQELNQDLLHCRRILTNWAIREAQEQSTT